MTDWKTIVYFNNLTFLTFKPTHWITHTHMKPSGDKVFYSVKLLNVWLIISTFTNSDTFFIESANTAQKHHHKHHQLHTISVVIHVISPSLFGACVSIKFDCLVCHNSALICHWYINDNSNSSPIYSTFNISVCFITLHYQFVIQ